ncbi:MAG: metalloregulator ArsR/SmtB family transcription factor [Pseudomonadota bacterium]
MTEAEALASLSTLAHATRLRMLKALVAAAPGGLTAGTLAKSVDATPSRASFHLSKMAEAGLVTHDRAAREVTYRIEFQAIGAVIRYLLEDCCANHPTVQACCVAAAPKS